MKLIRYSLMQEKIEVAAMNDNKFVTRKKTVFCLAMIFLFLLQNLLQQWYEPFSYLDEAFAFLFFPVFLFCLFKRKHPFVWNRETILFFLLLGVFWLFGWGGYFRYHYQPLANTAKDAYVNLKFFLACGVSYLLFFEETLDFSVLKKKLWPVLNGMTLFLFLLCLLDLCCGIFSTETRAGMRAVKLFYSDYTFLVGVCVFLCSIYLWYFEEKQKRIFLPLIALSFVMLCTRRVKSMGAVACIVLIFLLVFYKRQKINRKIMAAAFLVIAVAAAAAIYQIVSYYYTMGVGSARAVLTMGAPFLAFDHFPFGTGWGTYGSAFSTEPYSPVYGMYHMASVWGLSPSYHEFVSDTFWPMLLGECGYFGVAAYIGVLVLFARKVRNLRIRKGAYAAALLLFFYLLISSSSESAFANPIAVPFGFWIGFLLAEHKICERTKQEMIL
ncbi:MAG: hypothetical protein PUJ62_00875 [Lachnospiraceae bacterium]|nr:hypothetical protein [Lachnospiraceae bacterium]